MRRDPCDSFCAVFVALILLALLVSTFTRLVLHFVQ